MALSISVSHFLIQEAIVSLHVDRHLKRLQSIGFRFPLEGIDCKILI